MLDNIVIEYMPDRTTPVEFDYNRYRSNGINRTSWHGESHTDQMRDELSLLVGDPKTSANFRGVRKSTFKITRDQEVTGVDTSTELIAPLIANVSFSAPVGTSDAAFIDVCEAIRGLLDQPALMKSVALNGEI